MNIRIVLLERQIGLFLSRWLCHRILSLAEFTFRAIKTGVGLLFLFAYVTHLGRRNVRLLQGATVFDDVSRFGYLNGEIGSAPTSICFTSGW